MVTSTKVYIAFILATSAVLGVILVNRIYNSSQHFEPPVTGTDFQLTEIQISQYKVEAITSTVCGWKTTSLQNTGCNKLQKLETNPRKI